MGKALILQQLITEKNEMGKALILGWRPSKV
jgi:hypothetical protein